MHKFSLKQSHANLSFLLLFLFIFSCEPGEPGDPGIDGTNGTTSLVNIEDESAGDNCANGGIKISVGQDENGNEILDASEITSVSYVCNGSNGTSGSSGQPLVARTTSEPAGDNCQNGGTHVEIGTDDNNNSVLDDNEVQTSFFVCNGADGTSGTNGLTSLIIATPEASGTNCTNGGVKIEIGLDTNGDGSLDTDEIQSTYFICNGENGSDGTNGTNGTDGLSSLINITTEDPGANCLNGGLVIEIGLDLNGNGVLDAGELIGTPQYICNGSDGSNGTNGSNGTDGTDGRSPIVTTTTDPAECSNGGIEVTIGFDNDGDGTIDEILESFILCNGTDGTNGTNGSNGTNGFNSIITTTSVDPGTDCPNGGVLIEIGLDTNANGVLDVSEVQSSTYICNGTNGSNGSNGTDGQSVFVQTGASSSCGTSGGTLITLGYDVNDDGDLNDPEDVIIDTFDICNGSNGSNGSDGNSDNIFEFYFANGFDGYAEAIDVSISEAGSDEYGQTISVDFADADMYNSVLYFPKLQEAIESQVRDPFEIVEAILYLRSAPPADARGNPTNSNWIGVKTLTSEAPLVADDFANWTTADGDVSWASDGAAVTEAGGANNYSDQYQLPVGFHFDGYIPLLLNRTEVTNWVTDETTNKGLVLTMAGTNTYEIDFYSSEYTGDTYFRPTLYIKVKTNTVSGRVTNTSQADYFQNWKNLSYQQKIEPIMRRDR